MKNGTFSIMKMLLDLFSFKEEISTYFKRFLSLACIIIIIMAYFSLFSHNSHQLFSTKNWKVKRSTSSSRLNKSWRSCTVYGAMYAYVCYILFFICCMVKWWKNVRTMKVYSPNSLTQFSLLFIFFPFHSKCKLHACVAYDQWLW